MQTLFYKNRFTRLQKQRPDLRIRHAQTSFVHNTDREEIVPAFGAESVAVCLGADDRYAPFAELVISSIVANASPSRRYDIVVFSNGIAQLKQDAILRSVRGLSNVSVRFVESAAYLGGGSYRQIARQLGCTPKAVENALVRLRRKLRGHSLY